MKKQPTIIEVWEQFITFLASQAPHDLDLIHSPCSNDAIIAAEQRLQCLLPDELRSLYIQADGFASGAFLLSDKYRLLPLQEMVERSLELVGVPVILDIEAGEVTISKKVIRLLIAQAKEDDPDVAQISLRLRAKRPSIEIWYRESGIHTFAEVVDGRKSVTEWLVECLEYYS